MLPETPNIIIGASLSEPHIDETNVCNPHNIIIIIFFMVRPSPARRYILLYAVRNIFQHKPRGCMKETSACHVWVCCKHEEAALSNAWGRWCYQSMCLCLRITWGHGRWLQRSKSPLCISNKSGCKTSRELYREAEWVALKKRQRRH